jgi:hypothetical protein
LRLSHPSTQRASHAPFQLHRSIFIFVVCLLAILPAGCFPLQSTAPAGSQPQTGLVQTTAIPTRVLPVQTSGPTATASNFTLAPTQDLSAFLTLTPMPEIEGLFDFGPNIDPLTGLEVQDPSRLERRPVMVKISNYPRTGRPHAGLSFADLVFEYYIGYGLNRFAAIYLGKDASQVGPIRSGRLVDAQLAELYQAILVYGNADPTIDEVIVGEIGARALAERDLPTPPRYRIGPVPETNLFTNTAEVTDYVDQQAKVSNGRRDLRGMVFSELIHPVNKPAMQLGVQFWTTTRGEWHYDMASEKYLRTIENPIEDNKIEMIPLVDRLTDQQLAFSNVIIVFATYDEIAPTKHDIRLFNNKEGKRAIYFRDGVMIEGIWKTGHNGRPIQFYNKWNLPVHLKPGNTWIILTGDNSLFEEKEPGVWELRFDLP